jgi:glycine/D-amino acid oxidase-like deaminating enzyme/nitrite reductase/ring-hydroxylating ferredoxin subunit
MGKEADVLLPGKAESLWTATSPPTHYPALDSDLTTDVIVVGAGIFGLLSALLLHRAGRSVVVVEQSRVATGVTGYTSAKLSSLHQLTYARLESRFGQEGARTYGAANEAGLARIAGLAEELEIDCDLRRRPNYTYAVNGDDREAVREEAEAAARGGLVAAFVDAVPLPFPTSGAVCVQDQAEFQPVKFLRGLAADLDRDGCRIFENTRAHSLHDGRPCRVETTGGTITAEHVVIATHMPFPDRALLFARTHPERSYCVAARLEGDAPDGMFITASQPTRSIRSHRGAAGEWLVVGGEGHKVGQGGPTAPRYERLAEFATRHFPVGETEYRWSTQDNMPVDGVPFIGKLTPRSQATYVATGFRKWGLATAAAAAEIVADAIDGRTHPWQAFFDTNRLNLTASAPELVKENANVAFHFVADRLTRRSADSAVGLERGEGKVVSRHGRQVAIAREENGVVHAVSARCTHLGCILAWNDAEQSWDCPCHGSRFAVDGSVLQGPATAPLDPRDPPRDGR